VLRFGTGESRSETAIVRAPSQEDRRLRKLSEICLAFPESERTVCGDHADFRVRGRVFAYFLKNHHGDGIVSVCCKSALGENVDRAARDPRRFYLPAYIGARGWFGIRLDLGNIDWYDVQSAIAQSYEMLAPRSILSQLAEHRPAPLPRRVTLPRRQA
jgi:phosphoribosylglycinamide formyltransferase-1